MLKVKTVQGLAITVLVAFMMWLLLYLRSKGLVTVGDFALILWLNADIINETFTVAKELVTFSEDLGTCKQALTLLSTPHEIVDAPNAAPLIVTQGEIIFDKVDFHYRKWPKYFCRNSYTFARGKI